MLALGTALQASDVADDIINGNWIDVFFGPAISASSEAVVALLIVGPVFVALAAWSESYTLPVIWLIIGAGGILAILPRQARVIAAVAVALAVAAALMTFWYWGDRGGARR